MGEKQGDLRTSNWDDDKLGRKEQAEFLTEFLASEYQRLSSYRDKSFDKHSEPGQCHYVLNIDSPWGLGKTFFLKRWKEDLEDEDYLVLSFDAWANDFSKDPLLSFLSEIGSQLTKRLRDGEGAKAAPGNAERWERLKRATRALLKTYGPSVAKKTMLAAITASALGVPITSLPAEDAGESEGDDPDNSSHEANGAAISQKTLQKTLEAVAAFETQDLFKEQNARKQAIEDFRGSLHAVVGSVREHKTVHGNPFKLPVYIFIDELDRCRPDFTIELIKVVKHIFNVDDIFFVFATDGSQLQAALEGTYGARFDAETYFNRIFDREIHLRKPKNIQFSEALVKNYGIDEDQDFEHYLITAVDETSNQSTNKIKKLEREMALVADTFEMTLRDQVQVTKAFHSMVKFRSLKGRKTCSLIALTLLFVWQQRRQLFKDLESRRVGISPTGDYVKRFEEAFPAYNREVSELFAYYPRAGQKTVTSKTKNRSTVLEAFKRFLELRTQKSEQISEQITSHNRQYMFIRSLASEIVSENRENQNRFASPILDTYFDDVMMAG